MKAGGSVADVLFDWDGRGRDEPEVTDVAVEEDGRSSPLL
jgi:hypothetical protein